jgi:high-affinity nickel-transport protein
MRSQLSTALRQTPDNLVANGGTFARALGITAAIGLGALVGLRHAFEADHLAAVSALITQAPRPGRGVLIGTCWGIGHTLALLGVGSALVVAGTRLPDWLMVAFEMAVAVMLVGLGLQGLMRVLRLTEARGFARNGASFDHSRHCSRLHLSATSSILRPLMVGLVHGLAGSGALSALVFARLESGFARLFYMALFGVGSIAGMAAISAVAGLSFQRLGRGRLARSLGLTAAAISITVGALLGADLLQHPG